MSAFSASGMARDAVAKCYGCRGAARLRCQSAVAPRNAKKRLGQRNSGSKTALLSKTATARRMIQEESESLRICGILF